MRSLERVARPAAWAEPPAGLRFLADVATITDGELRKLRHDPWELVTRAVQPLLWLVVFGQVLARAKAIPTGNLPYLDFLAPGVLAQSALFSAIFFGIAAIWERDLGVIHVYLVSPVSRASLVTGKALSAGLRSLSQAIVVYALSGLIGVNLRLEIGPLLGARCSVVISPALDRVRDLRFSLTCLLVRAGFGQIPTPILSPGGAINRGSISPRSCSRCCRASFSAASRARTFRRRRDPCGSGRLVLAVEPEAFPELAR